MQTLDIRTGSREQMLDITGLLAETVHGKGWRTGALLVYCPHTTAALTINEAADPDVQRDMVAFMKRRIPRDAGFKHAEGNSDAHIKTSLFGPHCMVIVEDGRLRLGTWQGVYLCEWDGPRNRTVWMQFLPGVE